MDEVFGRLPTFGSEVQGFRSLRALVPIQTPPTTTSTTMVQLVCFGPCFFAGVVALPSNATTTIQNF
jgi:hypothetical protein